MIKKSLTILLTVALTTAASVWVIGRYFRFVPAEEYSALRSKLSVPEVPSAGVPGYVTMAKTRSPEAGEVDASSPPSLRAKVDYDRLLGDLERVSQSLERFNSMISRQVSEMKSSGSAETAHPSAGS